MSSETATVSAAADPARILVCSIAGIGDTLIATPLIHELRLNFPDARIDALVLWPGSRQILETNPHITGLYQHDFLKSPALGSLRFLLRLRRNRYDVSLNTFPQSRVEYRVIARIIGARTRVSHHYDHFRWLTPLLVNRTIPHDYSAHCIEQNLALLGCLGVKPKLREHHYEVYLTGVERDWAERFVAEHRLAQFVRLGVHIGSGRTKNLRFKRWPAQRYAELLQRLLMARSDLCVLLFGGPDEAEENRELARRVDSPRLILPQTPTVRHLAALLGHCDLFLSVDNFVMHLAAAMRVPRLVVIESPAWNPTIAPYRSDFVLVPNPIVHGRNLEYYRYDGRGIRGTPEHLQQCMDSVTVDAVFDALSRCMPPPGPSVSGLAG